MAAKVQIIEVGSPQEMETAISSYVVQGFSLANKTPSSATMIKKKEFNVIWAIIGFFVCLLPLIIYLIVYASDSDKMIEIRIRGGGGGTANLSELERLKDLLDRNVISREEFDEQKRRLL